MSVTNAAHKHPIIPKLYIMFMPHSHLANSRIVLTKILN